MTIATALDLSAPRPAPSGQATAARCATPGDRRSFAVDYGAAQPPEPATTGPCRDPMRGAAGPRNGTPDAEAKVAAAQGAKAQGAETDTTGRGGLPLEDGRAPETVETAGSPEVAAQPQLGDPLRTLLDPPVAAAGGTTAAADAVQPEPGAGSADATPLDEIVTADRTADAPEPPKLLRAVNASDATAAPGPSGITPESEATAETPETATGSNTDAPVAQAAQAAEAAPAAQAAAIAPATEAAAAAAKAQRLKPATAEAAAPAMGLETGPKATGSDTATDTTDTPLPKDGVPRAAENSPRLVSHSDAPGAPGEVTASPQRRGAEDTGRIKTDPLAMPRLSVEGPAPSSATPLEARVLAEAAATALERAAQAGAQTSALAASAPQAQSQPQAAVAAPLPATGLPQGQTPLLSLTAGDWPREMAAMLGEAGTLRRLGMGEALEIRLDPEALGQVNIRLEMRDGAAHVAIVTQTPEAARLFTDNQQRLAEALARAGLDLGSHSAGTGDGRGTGRETGAETGGHRPGQPAAADHATGVAALPADSRSGTTAATRRIDILA